MTAGRKHNIISVMLAGGLILAVAGCDWIFGGGGKDKEGTTEEPVQGWVKAQRLSWYQGTQGSRLMPWAWAQALEQAGNDQPLLARAHMESFRFLTLPESKQGLPVGFALDDQDDSHLSFTKLRWYANQGSTEQWVGLNCSACHTAEISYQGKAERIDGGPSLVDFQSFIEAVDAALAATRDDPAKWERFAAKVLAGKDTPANRDLLKTELGKLIAWEKENARLNETPMRYGYGRLDAFGHIFNKVSQLAVYQMAPPAARPTPNPADAPVSYPFLWGIYRQDKLQWNGIVKTQRLNLGQGYLDYGALGRNTGEVIGVFGDVTIKPVPDMHGFPSSIAAKNLNALETVLRGLQAPKWPARFGALNQARVDAGRTLFQQKGCLGCHANPPAGDSIYAVKMVPLTRDSQGTPNRNNTDPWMACNAISYVSASGKLRDRPENYFKGDKLARTEPLATLLTTTVVGTLLAKWQEILDTAVEIFVGVEPLPRVVGAADVVSPEERRRGRLDQCYQAKSPLFAYKGRQLDGIWATAPYLHNGSVPTLYDLLRAPADRPARFNLGTREYDPVRVGYVTRADAPGNGFTFEAAGPGNSNEGHDYNVGNLTEEERAALIEYMKTL
ncbi:MAG TPA: di-heme-cytochrome C peroxidase [Allosphingosinicella sp.]|nr:di-heme-cytochrome C peroxidase [Allosphingosinicella sp.]